MALFKTGWKSDRKDKKIEYALKLCEKGEYTEVLQHCAWAPHQRNDLTVYDIKELVGRMTDPRRVADFLIAGGYKVETFQDNSTMASQMQLHKFRQSWVDSILQKVQDEKLRAEIATKIEWSYAGTSPVSKAPLLCRNIIMSLEDEALLQGLLEQKHTKNNAEERLKQLKEA